MFLFEHLTLTPVASWPDETPFCCSIQYCHTFFFGYSRSVSFLKKIKHCSCLASLSVSSPMHQREILGMYQIALDFEVDPVVQLAFSLTILSNWYLFWVPLPGIFQLTEISLQSLVKGVESISSGTSVCSLSIIISRNDKIVA